MALESGTYISDLVITNPAHTDGLNQADSHLRLIKSALRATFPNINGAVTLSDEQLNALITASLVADGNSGAPSMAFGAEPALGFYRAGSAKMAFVGGVLRGNGLIPPGAIMDFAMHTAPVGWMECDGGGYNTASYPDLFTAIGYLWGGSGSTFFLPNAKNRYRRHRDPPGNASYAGTYQSWLVAAHEHTGGVTIDDGGAHPHSFSGETDVETEIHTHDIVGGQISYGTTSGDRQVYSPGAPGFITSGPRSVAHVHGFSGSIASSGTHGHTGAVTINPNVGIENRPQSMTVLTCIKI